MPGPDPFSSLPDDVIAEVKSKDEAERERRRTLEADLAAKVRDVHKQIIDSRPFALDPFGSNWKTEQLRREAIDAASTALRIAAGLNGTEHGQRTPERFVDMLIELTTPPDIKWTTFANENMDEMIVQRNIAFVSLCEHHVVPFAGVCHIGYIPRDRLCGLSKLARVVKHFSNALQVQERLTQQIADFLMENLDARGVAVVMDAEHMCMTIRGVHAPGTRTSTATMLGFFGDHERTAKMEFLTRLNGGL